MARRKKIRPLDEMLSKREQQVMEVLHRRERATVGEVFEALPDAASYNAVRGVLGHLEEKGRVRHEREGRRFVYFPADTAAGAGRRALRDAARTYFGDSMYELANTLLQSDALTPAELDRLQRLVDEARQRQGEER